MRWGAGVGKEVKGDYRSLLSFLSQSLSGGRQRRRRIRFSHSRGLWPYLRWTSQIDMVMDDVGWVVFLAAGEGMHGGPFLRIAAEFEDDFAAEDACV